MAKKPTIRLKKTELPIDIASAASYRLQATKEVELGVAVQLGHFHNIDGIRLPETPARFVVDFQSTMCAPDSITTPHAAQSFVASRRIADCASQFAPWIWRAKHTTVDRFLSENSKSEPETFIEENDQPFQFVIEFDRKIFDVPPTPEERKVIEEEFRKSKRTETLKRYISLINWESVKVALPVEFHIDLEYHWFTDQIFTPRVIISMGFGRAWISSESYKARSLLNPKFRPSTGTYIPAEYDLVKARSELQYRGKQIDLYRHPLDITFGIGIESMGLHSSRAITDEWINELLFGTDPTPEDVQSGKAPIPPKAEMVVLTKFLAHVPEMKRIVRTLMRIAKPYDPLSFLPVSL